MTASPSAKPIVSNLPLRVGIGGPVGSGKTALLERLCRCLADSYEIAAITNDIYTSEDAKFLVHSGVLPPERIQGVETGGCPHTAIREDASINLAAVDVMTQRFPALEMLFVESGGDNLSATFSPELADLTLYVIDVSAGDKIPRKGGPGITRSDLLVINKIDLAPHVGADLSLMAKDAARMRGAKPTIFANMRTGHGVEPIIGFLLEQGGFARRKSNFAEALPPLTEWAGVHAAGSHALVQQPPRFSSRTPELPK